jgi:hypothetical protein
MSNAVIQATIGAVAGEIAWSVGGPGLVRVFTFDSTGASVDEPFTVSVINVT